MAPKLIEPHRGYRRWARGGIEASLSMRLLLELVSDGFDTSRPVSRRPTPRLWAETAKSVKTRFCGYSVPYVELEGQTAAIATLRDHRWFHGRLHESDARQRTSADSPDSELLVFQDDRFISSLERAGDGADARKAQRREAYYTCGACPYWSKRSDDSNGGTAGPPCEDAI
jgi:hypothetical protein